MHMREAPAAITLVVDGEPVVALRGTNLAALLVGRAGRVTRTSVRGEPRAPLCGMGTCFECRVTVDGVPHVRACMTVCGPDMHVTTTGPELERADA